MSFGGRREEEGRTRTSSQKHEAGDDENEETAEVLFGTKARGGGRCELQASFRDGERQAKETEWKRTTHHGPSRRAESPSSQIVPPVLHVMQPIVCFHLLSLLRRRWPQVPVRWIELIEGRRRGREGREVSFSPRRLGRNSSVGPFPFLPSFLPSFLLSPPSSPPLVRSKQDGRRGNYERTFSASVGAFDMMEAELEIEAGPAR